MRRSWRRSDGTGVGRASVPETCPAFQPPPAATGCISCISAASSKPWLARIDGWIDEDRVKQRRGARTCTPWAPVAGFDGQAVPAQLHGLSRAGVWSRGPCYRSVCSTGPRIYKAPSSPALLSSSPSLLPLSLSPVGFYLCQPSASHPSPRPTSAKMMWDLRGAANGGPPPLTTTPRPHRSARHPSPMP